MSKQWESDFMSLAELMARTGLTRIQITNDIKNGLFPGKIVRRQPQVARRQYERWIEGGFHLNVRPPSRDSCDKSKPTSFSSMTKKDFKPI